MFEWLGTQPGFSAVLGAVMVLVVFGAAGYATFLERKVAAWVQDRVGPNRAGPLGLLQPVADGIKFLFKEESLPGGVDKAVFVLAPMLAFGVSMASLAVIPWGGIYQPSGEISLRIQVASVDIGLLYVLAFGALAVYGVVLGGWASNNKYSFYGSMRAAAQMLSYEIPLGLVILVVVLTTGHLRLEEIVAVQTESWWGFLPKWNIFLHPVAFVIMFITILAETNRAPFDLAECEQELVGGFHTEYSSMKFALFFMGEYAHMLIGSAFMTVLFFGGWHLPGIDIVQSSIWGVLLQFAVLWIKIALFILLFMWVRWTLPRFRFDQVMLRAWKNLVPLMLVMVAIVSLLVYVNRQRTGWALVGDALVLVIAGVVIALRPGKITGRQDHLPSAEQSLGRQLSGTST